MENKITAPTLLIGLGGIGSYVVDQIYQRLPESSLSRVAILAFDTNVNDLKNLELPKRNIFQTSTTQMVGQYLEKHGEPVTSWFPGESPEIRRKSLTDGAGQVRAVSRLALYSCIENGDLNGVELFMNQLFSVDGSAFNVNPKVVIVNSLAGGTGAGIFIQVAYYIKELLEVKYQKPGAFVSGFFLLPDALIDCSDQKIHHDQVLNTKANAYASLKEINYIFKHYDNNNKIELEYKPNQENKLLNKQPFEYCYLFDFNNKEGRNLKYFQNYLQQMIDMVYLNLFTPIGDNGNSKKDNQIRTLIREQGQNRYCIGGTSSITYPYNDIAKYIACRYFVDSLDKNWLKPDKDYFKEKEDYIKALERGEKRKEPIRSEIFCKRLQQYAESDDFSPFFKTIYNSLFTEEEKVSFVDIYLQRIVGFIENTAREDDKLNSLVMTFNDNENNTNTLEETPEKYVSILEEIINDLEFNTFEYIDDNFNYFLYEILMADADSPHFLSGVEHRLNTWALKKAEMHPLAVRYYLYQVKERVQMLLAQLQKNNPLLETAINEYKRAFDVDETPYTDSAIDRVKDAQKQPGLQKIFGNKLKQFLQDEYIPRAKAQVSTLEKYRVDKIKEKVLVRFNEQVSNLIKIWENFFDNLETMVKQTIVETEKMAEEHESEYNPSKVFVLATRQWKEKLYEDFTMKHKSTIIPPELRNKIYEELFKIQVAQKDKSIFSKPEEASLSNEKTRAVIDEVIDWFDKTKVRSYQQLDMNVIDALKAEATFKGQNESQYLLESINSVNKKAIPYSTVEGEAQPIEQWGMHSSIAEVLDPDLYSQLFKEPVLDEAFPKYTIIRERSYYNYKIEDFSKFSSGTKIRPAGSYYVAYKKLISDINNENQYDPKLNKLSIKHVTPHLDKRWHHPAYLPEINEEEARNISNNILKGLLFGLIYKDIRNITQKGANEWVFVDNGRVPLMYEGNHAESVYEVYHALQYNYGMVETILKRLDESNAEDKKTYVMDYHMHKLDFYDRVTAVDILVFGENRNILDVLFMLPEGSMGKDNPMVLQETLFQSLLENIAAYFFAIMGDNPETKEKIEKVFDHIDKKSTLNDAKNKRYSDAINNWNTVYGEFLKDFKK